MLVQSASVGRIDAFEALRDMGKSPQRDSIIGSAVGVAHIEISPVCRLFDTPSFHRLCALGAVF